MKIHMLSNKDSKAQNIFFVDIRVKKKRNLRLKYSYHWNIAHDEDDVSLNMNSHNGSPSSNSSSHSDQGSPSQNLQPQMYSSSSNKKSASNKKFADEPKQDTSMDIPTNQSHKIITKTAHKKHRISDKSDSDNSDFDESINDRDTQGLSKMQKGLRTAAADNTEVNITLW